MSSAVERIGWDCETARIGPGAPYPRPVVATFARRNGSSTTMETQLVASGDPGWPAFVALLDWLEADPAMQGIPRQADFLFIREYDRRPTREAVAHFGHGFDIPAHALHWPELMSRIFRALERGQFRDTLLREKLLNLAESGCVDYYFTPDGQARDISYKIEALGAKYLGKDRSSQKGLDADGNVVREDVWRLNFGGLDGLRSDQIPKDAADYAMEDAVDALAICEGQEGRVRDVFTSQGAVGHDGKAFDPFRTEPLHVGAMFCLSLATFEGFRVDPVEVASFEAAVEKARRPEQTELLYSSGLRTRALPPRPYANAAKHGNSGKPCACADPTGLHAPGTVKWIPAEPSHLSKTKLLELVVKTWAANRLCDEDSCPKRGQEGCEQHGLPPLKRTEPSKMFPKTEANPQGGQISCDGEVISDLAPLEEKDALGRGPLTQHEHWTVCDKLITNEIPRLKEALEQGGILHPGFDDFKKTSRTSSRKSKLYASVNVQQIARGFEIEEMGDDGKPVLDAKGKPKIIKVEPRHAYLPRREGWVLVSVDYSFIELVTLAQTTKQVIGYSVLLEKINKGFDPHAYLGSRLAFNLEPDFVAACEHLGKRTEDDIYHFFVSLKGGTDDEKKFYKSFRNLGKPAGLGFGGGLGARTFISYAKKLYGITIKSIEQAKKIRQGWLDAYPENGEYLNRYVRDHLRDEMHSTSERERFAYFSPLGTYRSKCTFTEVANGKGLQSPAAELMKVAFFKVQRACWDSEMRSCLYGCRGVAAIHDELIISMPNDQYLHERAFEASRLWIEGANVICTEALVKAEPAAMHRWSKGAEPVYSLTDMRLRPWEEHVKYKVDENGRLWCP